MTRENLDPVGDLSKKICWVLKNLEDFGLYAHGDTFDPVSLNDGLGVVFRGQGLCSVSIPRDFPIVGTGGKSAKVQFFSGLKTKTFPIS